MEIQKSYSFKQLQSYLEKWDNRDKCLIVKNEDQDVTAIMHIFWDNFCGDWLSGDGVLFYSDGETHSADDNDMFTLISIIKF